MISYSEGCDAVNVTGTVPGVTASHVHFRSTSASIEMSTQKKISDIFAKATSGDSQTGQTLTPTPPDIDESPSASVSHSASSSTSWKPNYPDFFVLSEDEIRSDSAKMKLLKTTWDTAHKFEFPVRSVKNFTL